MRQKSKIGLLVQGYLGKKKGTTTAIMLLLGSIVALLLVGNQLFENVNTANRMNLVALEGTRHVCFYHLNREQCQLIQKQPYVEKVGVEDEVGITEDGTHWYYDSADSREMEATVACKYLRQTKSGRWPEKKNEVAFSQSYMEQYQLKLGDTVCVDLLLMDEYDSEKRNLKIEKQKFVIVGIMENKTGFTSTKMAEISKEYADWIQNKKPHKLNSVSIQFTDEKNIEKNVEKLNKLLSKNKNQVSGEQNTGLNDLLSSEKVLRQQCIWMNGMIWLICVLVIYNVFYNRFFRRKREFQTLRKLGFHVREVRTEILAEFGILLVGGVVGGLLVGMFINWLIYKKIMMPMVDDFESIALISSGISYQTLGQTLLLVLLVLLPSVVTVLLQLQNVAPVQVMKRSHTNQRKKILGGGVVVIAAVMFCSLAIQCNKSDSGIEYVRSYVPGDLQVTIGDLQQVGLEELGMKQKSKQPEISQKAIDGIRKMKDVEKVEQYDLNLNAEKDPFLLVKAENIQFDEKSPFWGEEMVVDFAEGTYAYTLLQVVSTDSFTRLASEYHAKKGEHLAILDQRLAEDMNLKIGDTFSLYGADNLWTNSIKKLKAVEVKLAATENEGAVILSENHLSPGIVLVDSETADLFTTKRQTQVVNIWTKKGCDRKVQAQLQKIPELSDCTFHNANQQLEEYTESDNSQQTMHGFFLILLAGIGMVTCFETVVSNLQSRRHEFSLMRKLGLRRSEIDRKVRKEYLIWGLMEMAVVLAIQLILWRKKGSFAWFVAVDVAILVCSLLMPMAVMQGIHKSE